MEVATDQLTEFQSISSQMRLRLLTDNTEVFVTHTCSNVQGCADCKTFGADSMTLLQSTQLTPYPLYVLHDFGMLTMGTIFGRIGHRTAPL